MKKSILLFVASLSLLGIFPVQTGAADHFSYQLFPPGSGIPTTVTGIFCQPRGYVWLSSLEGLTRIDNYQQHLYLHNADDERSLPSNSVYSVYADKADNVWAMTERGVARYNSATDDFDRYDFLAYSAFADGIGCYFGQLDTLRKYDYETGNINEIRPLASERPFKIEKMLPWTSGRILLFSRDRGILIYDPNSDTVINPPVNLVNCSDIFVDSRFYVYVARKAEGFDIYGSNLDLVGHYTKENSGLVSNFVNAFTEQNGIVYIGTLHGMSVFYPESGAIISLKHDFDGGKSLPANSVISLATDKAGMIYAGRAKGGLFTMVRSRATEYGITEGAGALCPDGINDIFQYGSDNRVWCATDGSGIASYDPETATFRRYPSTAEMKPVSLARLNDGKFLFFDYPKQFCTFDPSSGAVAPFNFGSPILDRPNSGITYEVIQGQGSLIYISTGNSFYTYDSDSRELRSVSIPAGTTSNSRIIAASGNNSSQYFNNNRFLFKYDAGSMLMSVVYDLGPDVRIYSTAYDGGEHLWMATEEGLAVYNLWSNTYELIENEFIKGARGVIVDKNGKVLVSTIHDVFIYNPSSKSFYRLDVADGISLSSGFNPKPCLLTASGDVYLAGSTHLARIDSDFSIRPQDTPAIVLESVSVDGVKLADLSKVKVTSTTSDVEVKVFVNEDVVRSNKKYRFKLNNTIYDKDEPVLHLSSCNPGSYDIDVSCSTANCEWTEWQTVGKISVANKWYESWWFFAMCLLLSLAAFGYLYFAKFPKRKNVCGKDNPSEASSADKEHLNNLVNLNHNLRTPLSLIMGPLENVLKDLPKGDPNEKRLKGVFKQAARMKTILDDFFVGEDIEEGVPATASTPAEKETSALRPATPEQQNVPIVSPEEVKKAKSEENTDPVPDQVGIAKEHLETVSLSSLLPTKEEYSSVVELKDASILLVEDDIELRSYVRDELKDDVKQVFVAGNGIEAIEVLNRQNIDIIVSDVMMPEMDGFALCRYVKTTVAVSHIPVILLTARTDENSRIIGYKNGADDYITKPFDLNYLKTAITNLFLSRALVRKRYSTEGAIPDSRETTFSSADENFMKAFETFVRENIGNADLDIRMLVEGMNMSRTVLYNKVKQLTGMNLQNYVNKCRMEYVIELMGTTELSLAEIAEQSGFNSPRYFSTSFKNYTGMTPSQYKKDVIDAGK